MKSINMIKKPMSGQNHVRNRELEKKNLKKLNSKNTKNLNILQRRFENKENIDID